MAVTITDSLLNGLRRHIADMTAYAEYKIGGSWTRAEINSKDVLETGAVNISFYVRRSGDDTATEFRLKDANGNVLADREETIAFITGIDALLYRFKFSVTIQQPEPEPEPEPESEEEES